MRGTGLLLGTLAFGLPAGRAVANPVSPQPSLPELLVQLQDLYLRAEKATETYNQAKADLKEHSAKAARLRRQLADERTALAQAKDRAGQLAREQYQNGGVSPYMNLVLSDSPEELFSQTRFLQRAAGSQAQLLEELTNGAQRIASLSSAAQDAVDSAEKLTEEQRVAKEDVQARLADVERVVSGLTGTQLAELQRLEQLGIDQAQRQLLASGRLGAGGLAPSDAGFQAVRYAYRQLGKPYVWGAEGPDSFDCSGLTSQAWLDAGMTIPRTSQQQWKQLPQIPLNLLRPGDLVIYFPGATHVAIYIGDGLVIQAPRPGAFVKISPIAANPILGAVRPDAENGPMDGTYKRPAASRSATAATPFA
jgi:cell wall-associated NlpC family hydrolase